MQRPTCSKCGSNFLRLVEEVDGYYSRCMCGTFTLLQSKFLDSPIKDVDLNGLDPDEKNKKPRYNNFKFKKPTASYYCVLALKNGPLNSSELASYVAERITTSTYVSIYSNIGATLSKLADDHEAVKAIELDKTAKGGYKWALGEYADDYLSLYSVVEEKAVIAATVKAEQRKPTLLEMLHGQKIRIHSGILDVLYG